MSKIIIGVVTLVLFGYQAFAGKLLHAKVNCEHCKNSMGHRLTRRSIDLEDVATHLNDLRLPREVVPTGYRLHLTPYLEEARFKGRVWINITCLEGTDTVILHAHEDLNISHSDVTIKKLNEETHDKDGEEPHMIIGHPMNFKGVTISSTKKDPNRQWYIIMLSEKLWKNHMYQVDIAFSGDLNTDDSEGFFRGSYQDHKTKEKRWFGATHMRPTNARRVFPCFDEPAYKVPFEIKVARKENTKVLSNMVTTYLEDVSDEPGWKWQQFQKSPPLSTFSVGWLISDFEHVIFEGQNSSIIRVYGRSHFLGQLREVVELAPKVLTYLEEYLRVKYPSSKLDLVALPHYKGADPADHWGLILFKESDLVGETNLWYITQELANQWVGHLTTPHWWNYAQTNMALTNYLVNDFTMQWRSQYVWTQGYSLYYGYSERYPFSLLGSQVENIRASKCTWLLRMLNYTLTEKSFRGGLQKFLEDRQYKTFSENDLWAALTTQSRKDATLPESVNVADVAKSWLKNERFPVVTVNRNYADNTADIEQHMFLRERPHDVPNKEKMVWYIPIMYISPDNLDISAARPVAWMKNEKEITVADLPDPDKFIIVNPEEIGMFMINYDLNNWALLANYLVESVQGNRPPLSTPVRAKLLHDSWNLAFAGELNFASALNMTLFLKYEKEFKVWDAMFTMIDHISRQTDGTEAGLKFEEYCRRLLTHLLNSLEGEAKTSELGRLANQMLSQVSYQPYLDKARDVYKQWMDSEDPDAGNPVSDNYLCTVFKWGSMEEWEFSLQRIINFPDSRQKTERSYLLKTLAGCPRQPEKVERFEEKPHMWEYLISCATSVFKTQEGYDMVSELYVARQGEFGTAESIMENSLKTIKEEARWSEENMPEMEAWLDNKLAEEDNVMNERGTHPIG
uniref:Aminopeptidase n=1 Tax=Timema shepardi TaxID=629360 RepID=A0A7R9AKD4_TIMSH|nr:unnamed protein product [Timema shepardi]